MTDLPMYVATQAFTKSQFLYSPHCTVSHSYMPSLTTMVQIYSTDLHLENVLYAFHLPLNATHTLVSERLLFSVCHNDETEMVRRRRGREGEGGVLRKAESEGVDERGREQGWRGRRCKVA